MIREKQEIKYLWNIESMYGSEKIWNEDFEKLEKYIGLFDKYKNTLTDSGEILLEGLELFLLASRILENLSTYSKMKLDEDLRNNKSQEKFDKIETLSIKLQAKTSYVVPKIMALTEEKLKDFYKETPELKDYHFFIEKILKNKEHTLSDGEEYLLAETQSIAGTSYRTFSMFMDADLKFNKVLDKNNKEYELTQGTLVPLLQSKDRILRENAFNGFYNRLYEFENSLSTMLNQEISKNHFYARVRKHKSPRAKALFENFVPETVYDNLIETVHEFLPAMHRYVELRKKVLKLDKLNMYDLYVPMFEIEDDEIPFEEAKKIVLEAVYPLGEEYQNIMSTAFDDRWIDVYENEGKRSGAYSWGSYDSKPYILLNYHEKLGDMFTLIHELGHSMHSYLTRNNQEYLYGSYNIFLAEVASTTNEALLIRHLLENEDEVEKQMYLINYFLEQYRGTLFRQTMFAEYEHTIHEYVGNGGSITADYLKETYYNLNKTYYGDSIEVDKKIEMEWARIPHFYYDYYVYQYATGFSAAMAFVDQICSSSEGREKYLGFLKAGATDYPLNILKNAGVDMESKEPVRSALRQFELMLERLEKLIEGKENA